MASASRDHGVPSLNDRAMSVVARLISDAPGLGCEVTRISLATVVDAGVNTPSSLDAGLLMARIATADFANVGLVPSEVDGHPLPAVTISVRHPTAACMASQYAGWQIKHDDFFAMTSGPIRAAYGKEDLYDDIGFRERPGVAVGLMETASLPPAELIDKLSEQTNVVRNQIALLCAPTASLAGSVQVVARSVETALHKLHELDFPLGRIQSGFGHAPLPPVAADDLAAMGRTNDAVLYGGRVTLYVRGDDDILQEIGPKLPSGTSDDAGRPFGEIFADADHDFYEIDPMLFAPAQVSFQNLETGNTFTFGETNAEVLKASFFSR